MRTVPQSFSTTSAAHYVTLNGAAKQSDPANCSTSWKGRKREQADPGKRMAGRKHSHLYCPARPAEHSPGDGGCWLWTRSKSPDGYGWASYKNRTCQAHRLVYTFVRGPVPEGMHLDHLCRVRHCVNPDHLEPVTPRENLARGDTPTAWRRCQRCGGEYSQYGKQRRCLRCLREYSDRTKEKSA